MAILSNLTHIINASRRARNLPERIAPHPQALGKLLAPGLAEPSAPQATMPWPYIDSLFDFLQVVPNPITTARMPSTKRVAIIGSGAAGLCAGYELLRCGIVPVIYEAGPPPGSGNGSRPTGLGGRAWSYRPIANDPNVICELGAMRVPPSQNLFTWYANMFGMQTGGSFPDPGKVPTRLYYENQTLDWNPAIKTPPAPFDQIVADFDNWSGPIIDSVQTPLNNGDWQGARQAWQILITKYANMSFLQAVAEGIPSWTAEQLNQFGAIGLGSGGFGPLYEIGTIELLRIMIMGWEDDQAFWIGMQNLEIGFYTTQVTAVDGTPMGSLQSNNAVIFNTRVTQVNYDPSPGSVVLWFGSQSAQVYDAVIIATTTRSMEQLGLTLPQGNFPVALQQEPKIALRDLHMASSSKMFIVTATKFWQNPPTGMFMPQNIQTDELVRGVYCLDYPGTTKGVVLVSYTWEDDSIRMQALSPIERQAYLLSVVAKICPEWASYLVPVNPSPIFVDWQSQQDFFGAFKLNYPGSEAWCQAAYYQFQTAGTPQDTGIYLAGDGVSWSGGWTEGALQTALNAASAVARRFHTPMPPYNCVDSQSATLYTYDPAQPSSEEKIPGLR